MNSGKFSNPSLLEIEAFLRRVRRIAIIGLSPDPERPSHMVARTLQRYGFEIVPVRPGVECILGERAYTRLDAVPGAIDLVDVFRRPEHVPAIVDDCLRLGLGGLWLQDGVIHPQATERARAGGMFVVMNDCLARVCRKLDWGGSKAHG